MTSGMLPLSNFRENVYSQNGEDGVIREILNRLKPHANLDSWCVEFGAWDGVFLSNTCRLIREEGFSAVLIEGDPGKVERLEYNFPQENVYKVGKFIRFEGPDSLDSTLRSTPIPKEFDFLSIDVDGVDYHIFESLNAYRPKIVCIEFSPAIPNSVEYINPRDFSVKHGSSARAIVNLANEKGYDLATATNCNLFLVRNENKVHVVGDQHPEIAALLPELNEGTYIFPGYDGSVLSNKDTLPLIWHNIKAPIASMQFLPKGLRRFSPDYTPFQRWLFGIWSYFINPKNIVRRALRRMGHL
jgi:hypothetical protein